MEAKGHGNGGGGTTDSAVDINQISRKVAVDQQMLEVALDMLGRDTNGLLKRSVSGADSWLRDSHGGA